MNDKSVTNKELIEEISALKRKIREIEQSGAEYRPARDALKKSEALYHDMVETSQDPVWQCDAEGRYTYLNPAWESVLGYTVEEMIGRKFSDFQSPETASRDLEEFVRLMQGGSVKNYETIHIGKSGNEINLIFNAKFLISETGRIIGTSGTAHDITGLKKADSALRDSEEKYRLTFDTSPDAINISRLEDGLYVDINRGFTQLAGFSREEVIGKTSLEINLWHDPADRQKLVQGLREKGFYENLEARLRRKDGSVGTGLISARIVSLKGVPHIISVTRDITEIKKAEAEKAALEEQYKQSQKLEAIGQLAGGVAHDFNNMLNIILGYSQLALLKIDPSGPLHSDIQEIISAGKRSSDLVRQLLAFARKQTISPAVMNINEIIESMLNMLRRLIGEDIDLCWKPARDLWPVKMDPVQVDQIMANLSVNARDAISGVGKMTIETGNAEFDGAYCARNAEFIPGQYVLLAVSDNGCGMLKEIQDQIFEPFFSTKMYGKGTGLGLATVYGIVKQNNGFINVYSEPGKGATFKIYLPRYTEKESVIEAPRVHAGSVSGTETLLLVEDDKSLLKMIKIILEELGYTVLAAGSPKEAIQLAEEFTGEIHLVLTDVVMPEMNGRDLQKQLSPIRPDIKCLFMSGYTANVIALRGILDEDVHFLQKPFSMEILSAKLKQVLGRS
ncbi:MAG: PAS domain-containing sensor histidine kinase [Desulfobacteraceae bacterium]|nr:MAG: PAS domain-containing sensor histidine kinase [Desulfobacteraceae bacterium]